MFTSFSEFKFFKSFRVPVEIADDLRFLVENDDQFGKSKYIEDARLIDISISGFGFSTTERLSVGERLNISLQFKKMHLDLSGRVVRAFSDSTAEGAIIYGVELEEEKNIKRFLEKYIASFSIDRLKDCLTDSVIKENYAKASDGFEIFSLLISLFKDINSFGKKKGFIKNMLEEVIRVLNAQRASIFLINPETNELEAIEAIGVDKSILKFDYRMGIAGSVFTTGIALNIDTEKDKSRFNEHFDKHFNFKTKSIICYPIHNREDKIVGVIEVMNKRSGLRFNVDDEKTMKVLSLVFSSVYHDYNPISQGSKIRNFSPPFDREDVFIGKTSHVSSLRKTIVKLKDLDSPVYIYGEHGSGKELYAKILHVEGQRGLERHEVIESGHCSEDELREKLFGNEKEESALEQCKKGTLVIKNIEKISLNLQRQLSSTLESRQVHDSSKICIDARIIATSSEDLGKLVDQGKFDSSLYKYVSKAFVNLEPMRRKVEDIKDLVDYFLKKECKKQGLLLKSFSQKTIDKMTSYDWPGNVSELKLCVERAVLYYPKTHIINDIELDNNSSPLVDINARLRRFGDIPHVTDSDMNLKDRVALVEREMILDEIKRHNGNKTKASKEMGISREALRKKLLISQEIVDRLEAEIDANEAA